MRKKWFLEKEEIENNIDIELNPILLEVLKKRGLTEENDVNKFLYSKLDDLYNPFLMKDMKKAAARIIKALNNNQKIIVFGDYDVDGITSTAVLYKFFHDILGFSHIDYYLPDRHQEGYGLNLNAVEKFIKKDFDLLITVDCGITALKEVNYAVENGLDVVITDHHQPKEKLPSAAAVLDPHRKDDSYPFSLLAGVGVAFKLCQALTIKMNRTNLQSLYSLLDIVTMGTVADIVPLTDENRIITKNGLELLNTTKNIGLQALIKKTGLEETTINPGRIGYILAPHLNAAGRMIDAEIGIKLLTAKSAKKAELIADKLIKINKDRQNLENKILKEAVEMVEETIDLDKERGIVLASKDWHQGVIGIVASKLVEKYYRPTILIALEDGIGKGSCRSIDNLNLYQAVKYCSPHLEGFGGHPMAAGLTVTEDKVGLLRKEFNNYLQRNLETTDLVPRLQLDTVLKPDDIDMDLYRELEKMEPYGVGNPRPRFLLNNVKIADAVKVGKNKKHLKFCLNNGLSGIGFDFADNIEQIKDETIDLACIIELNQWNGKRSLQLRLEDFNNKIDNIFYPVTYKKSNVLVYDKRGINNKLDYLADVIDSDKKTAVYINQPGKFYLYKKKLMDNHIFLSNKKDNLKDFIKDDKGILLFSSIKNINEIKIEQLILASLPFSLNEIIKMTKLFDDRIIIHLLFGEKERKLNQQIIKNSLPDKMYLRKLYIHLKTLKEQKIMMKNIEKLTADIGIKSSRKILKRSLTVLQELGLIERQGAYYKLLPEPVEKLDLSDSISYNETINIIDQFQQLIKYLYADNLFKLIDKLKNKECLT